MIACLAGCGEDPTSLSTRNLHGFWNTEGATQTVFAFLPPEGRDDVFREPELDLPADEDISVVFTGSVLDRGLTDSQVATYELQGDALVQTVIGDVLAPPGTMYSTKILAFDGATMTLESKNDPSGERTYTKSARCPNESRLGWSFGGGGSVTDPTVHDPAIAIDAEGHVHTLIGSYGQTVDAYPMYQLQGDGCTSFSEPFPVFRRAGIVLVGGEVHTFLEMGPGADDFALVHAHRADPSAAWQTEKIAGPPASGSPTYSLFLFADGADLVAVTSRTGGELEVYRRSGTTWQTVALDASAMMRVEDAAIGPSGEIVLLGLDKIRKLEGAAFEDIALPRPQIDVSVNGGVRVDASGKIHATWAYEYVSNTGTVVGARSVYGVYDGAWTEHLLGPAIYPRPVPGPNGELRVLSSPYRAAIPAFTLTEIAAGGAMKSARIGLDRAFGSGPDGFARLATAVGPDDTIATSWASHAVYVRHPDRLREPRMIDYTIQITGPGRVTSVDGRIDCTETCTVPVPLGTRLQIQVEPEAGYAAGDSSCPYEDAHAVDGYCWHDVSFETDETLGNEIVHAVMFYKQ